MVTFSIASPSRLLQFVSELRWLTQLNLYTLSIFFSAGFEDTSKFILNLRQQRLSRFVLWRCMIANWEPTISLYLYLYSIYSIYLYI